MRLPTSIDPQRFDREYRVTPSEWRFAIDEVCAAHGVAPRDVRAYPDGSNLVAEVNGAIVVKIFPPFHRHQWESERRTLPRFHGRLPIAVPELFAVGSRDDDWTYLIVEKLPGVLVEACWPSLTHADKDRILTQIGETTAAAHALPVDDLSTLPPDWNAFIREQAVGCRARHARFGMPAWLFTGLDAIIGDGKAFEVAASDRVILTGEYTPFNLLAQETSDGWQLSGMFDFGDAMVGAREYDLLGPSVFLGKGDAERMASLLSGYYGRRVELDHEARLRLLALLLLHRYASFDNQIRIADWRERARSLDELARLIWP